MFKKILLTFFIFIVLIVGFGIWFISLLTDETNQPTISKTLPSEINYITQGIKESRGKILAVVTSADLMGVSGKTTGYELTELARAYYVFQSNGFEVDIASPKGGEPPVVIDDDDMGIFDYAFLNDVKAQTKVKHSIPVEKIDPDQYKAVYFVGGKGAMFDFPDNLAIQKIVRNHYQTGKVIGAVCHGPAALVNVTLDNGNQLLSNKKISAFTNEEELFLIKDARDIFPFLLEDKIVNQGAFFNSGSLYLDKISHDGNLITGQNPWSVWSLAEAMISQLGYKPIPREITAEENTVSILQTYDDAGFKKAKTLLKIKLTLQNKPLNRNLIAVHGLVAAMQWEVGKMLDLIRLTNTAKQLDTQEK